MESRQGRHIRGKQFLKYRREEMRIFDGSWLPHQNAIIHLFFISSLTGL
jgi:hypothetical protein